MTTKAKLIISISINIGIILFIAGKRMYYRPSKPVINVADNYNTIYKSIYDSLGVTDKYVMLGTSITQGFPVSELLGPQFVNRGIGWNTTGHLTGRLDSLSTARAVFIEAGINDIINNRTVAEVFNNYKKIIDRLKCRVVVQSVLPVSGKHSVYSDSVRVLNNLLRGHCNKNNIDFLDIDIQIDSFSVDGLHPNGGGYKIWADAIKNYLDHSP